MFQTVHPNDVLQRASLMDFDILRVPYGFSMLKMQLALARVKERFIWKQKDGIREYQAIGLQYSDPSNPYFDAVDLSATYSVNQDQQIQIAKENRRFQFFDRRNLAGDEFDFVFRRVFPLPLFRTRLLMIAPNSNPVRSHSDGARTIRLHIPIETSQAAWFAIDGRQYHLPADGSAYLINTSLMHQVGNAGEVPRTHLVSVLYSMIDGHLNHLAWLAVRDFAEENHGRQNSLLYAHMRECDQRTGRLCELCGSHGARVFHVPDKRMLRSVCAICIENVIRKSFRYVPEASAKGKYKEHAVEEVRAVSKLKDLIGNAIESYR